MMLLTSPRIPSILLHITVATSACHPVSVPPAITLQHSEGNSLVSVTEEKKYSEIYLSRKGKVLIQLLNTQSS